MRIVFFHERGGAGNDIKFSLGVREIKFALYLFVVAAIFFTVIIVGFVIIGNVVQIGKPFVWMPILLVGGWVTGRFCLSLPAIAIGYLSFGLEKSWRATALYFPKGLWLTMQMSGILSIVLVDPITFFLAGAKTTTPFSAAMPFLFPIFYVFHFIFVANLATYLAFLYGKLGEKPDWIE